ncbi:hypothetical protein DM02DRAFT_283354 [Periconia macrospinosa]|uniref:GYF domain-containing protein n=1 Tax=Periconia macrospinosa TaxID=97972 RepID=A0A2V1EDW8_9PLEO|nr:hypothetical protein DM02DRAFT_283354 [Periconia macrospinosa]
MASSSNNFSAARPKRAGDHFTRTHHLDSNEPSTKKPRFDPRNPSTLAPDNDDDDDPTLDADVIGKSGGVKRNAVNIDGYDSDSSTENFNERAEARNKKQEKEDDDDDDDMFADDDKDDDQDEDTRRGGGGDKKKNVRFLDDQEIEGQEATSKSGGHVAVDFGGNPKARAKDEESSSESDDEEERDMLDPELDEEIGAGGKKKHAPKLDAFNMKAEQEEGRFDASGNYVRRAQDPLATYDSWLNGISKKEMKKAKEAQDKRDAELRERERAADSIVTSEELSTMILHLEMGETPMEALARYGKMLPQKKPTPKASARRKKKQSEMDVDQQATTTTTAAVPPAATPDPSETEAATKAKQAIDAITDSAGHLTDRGVEDVYHLSREAIMRQYKRETGEDWKHPNPPKVEYEFHWLTAPEDDVNGPYDVPTMRAWQASGQFEHGAEFRRVGEVEWSRVLDLDDDE